jgi:uncharacterized protein DUF3168
MLKGPIDILKSDLTVAGLVGDNKAGVKTKVYPVFCPQPESPPYIVLRQTSKVPQDKQRCGFECSFDVYSYATSYDEAEAIDLAIVEALDNKVAGTYNGVQMGYTFMTNTSDQHVEQPIQLYVKVSSFTTSVKE